MKLPWKKLARVFKARWLAEQKRRDEEWAYQHKIIKGLLHELGRTEYSDVWKAYYPHQRVESISNKENLLLRWVSKNPT